MSLKKNLALTILLGLSNNPTVGAGNNTPESEENRHRVCSRPITKEQSEKSRNFELAYDAQESQKTSSINLARLEAELERAKPVSINLDRLYEEQDRIEKERARIWATLLKDAKQLGI